jgi:hypothetical protein
MTIEKGIQIQQQHLSEWKRVLKEDVYEKLALWTMETNLEAKTGNDIRWGYDLISWVQNYSIDKINSH